MSLKRSFSILLAIGLVACTGNAPVGNDPKSTLTEYISRSFAVNSVQDRAELAKFLTGDAKTRLVAWSDDQFREAFLDSKREFIKLAFREMKAAAEDEVSITYDLTYLDSTRGEGDGAKVTNRKLCQLVREDKRWYIREVKNIKELIEYRNEMSLP